VAKAHLINWFVR